MQTQYQELFNLETMFLSNGDCFLNRTEISVVDEMDCRNGESPSTLEKALPLPPPMPPHFNTRLHQKGLVITGSKIRGHCFIPNAVNSSWDRLFDEGYRTDVTILTDDGGVIHAHASILVSSCAFVKL